MYTNYANQLPYYAQIPQTYGAIPVSLAEPEANKGAAGVFIPGQRRRINIVPVVIAILVPWALFCVMFWVQSFEWHYKDHSLVNMVEGLGFLVVVASGIYALGSVKQKAAKDPKREPNWFIFMFVANLFAFLAAMLLGDINYFKHMQPYYDIMNLNTYTSVDPSVLRGQMVMDAGRIIFTQKSRLDVSKSVGFKNQDTYCVAPITIGNSTTSLQELRSYDFWAVGINCCSSEGADFHCGQFNNPNAHGGLRLMANDQRSFFRLAVQQAEAAYGVKAMHPLFFEWVQDPIAKVDNYQDRGVKYFLLGIFSSLMWQTFVVACAVLAFAKLGQST